MNGKVKQNIQNIITDITESYVNYPVSQSQFKCKLPNKSKIIEITEKLLCIIFPGYFDDYSPDVATLPYYIGDLLLSITQMLSEQLSLALINQYDTDCEYCKNKEVMKQRADDICFEFLKSIPKLRRMLACDVEASLDGDPAAVDKDIIIFCYPGIYAISIYRIAHELHKLKIPYIPRIMTEHAHSKTGIDIHPGAEIGEYFFIDHGTGIVIGETTKIGSHVKLYQGVTLGAISTKGGQSLSGTKRHPTIEDNVTIYSGATVLGGNTVITKNTVIGGNAFITESK